jgi:Domain of unknown function (DUF222)
VAELIRRSPEDGCELEGPAQMPATWHEFTVAELGDALAETRQAATGMLELAHDLETRLPGTRAAFRSGVLRLAKVEIIARAVANQSGGVYLSCRLPRPFPAAAPRRQTPTPAQHPHRVP